MECAVVGQCDRCQKDIYRKKGEDLTVLNLVNYKMDMETYRIEHLICSECRKSFVKWMARGDTA